MHLNELLECVVEIDLVQSLCDKRSLESKHYDPTFEVFNELVDVGD